MKICPVCKEEGNHDYSLGAGWCSALDPLERAPVEFENPKPDREAAIQQMVEALEEFISRDQDDHGLAKEALETWKKVNE